MTTPTPKPHVRKQYWNEPELGAWERAYLPEILRGLALTQGARAAVLAAGGVIHE